MLHFTYKNLFFSRFSSKKNYAVSASETALSQSEPVRDILNSSVNSDSPAVQTKLKVGEPNDKFEQEADRVADQVVSEHEDEEEISNSGTQVQRMCDECEDELRLKPAENQQTQSADSAINQLGGGRSLPATTRGYFESRFHADFSNVRIHTDTRAQDSAQALQARAFTSGHNVVFGRDEFNPHTQEGKHLIAHELTHVLQQGKQVASGIQRQERHPIEDETAQEVEQNSRLGSGNQPADTPAQTQCGDIHFQGEHWNDAYRGLVCEAFNRLPPAAQTRLQGINITHNTGVSMSGGEPGHYDMATDTVDLFCNVFGSCRNQIAQRNMTPQQRRAFAISLIHHEFAHVIDLRPIQGVVAAETQARIAFNSAVGQQGLDLPDDDFAGVVDPVEGPSAADQQAQQQNLERLERELDEASAARSRERSESGVAMLTLREQRAAEGTNDSSLDNVQQRLVAPNERRQNGQPTNAFQRAAEADGVVRIPENQQNIRNSFGHPFELRGGPRTANERVCSAEEQQQNADRPWRCIPYANSNWMEMFAQSFMIYINDPQRLRTSHPHIFSYLQSRYPSS